MKKIFNNPHVRFIEFMLFGTSSMVTSTLAALWVYNQHPTGWKLYGACIAISITLTPAALAIGRYIVQGAFREAAKEVKE